MSEFVPLCMSRRELELWREANNAIPDRKNRAKRPCVDCPASFAAEMRLAMRCNGLAHSQRRLLQWREASARKRAGIRIRRNAAEVAALRADVVAAKAAGEPTSVVAARLGIPVTYVQKLARAA